MALFDTTLLFSHTGSVYNLTAGEFVSLVGATTQSTSSVVNLGNARDLGIGPGAEVPKVVVDFGVGITSSCASMTMNIEFQGSTDSSTWTTYIETGAALMGTASTGGAAALGSFAAGSQFRFDVPRRPPGIALPLYYRLNYVFSGYGTGTPAVSTGTVFSGILLEAAESAATLAQYQSGFSVS